MITTQQCDISAFLYQTTKGLIFVKLYVDILKSMILHSLDFHTCFCFIHHHHVPFTIRRLTKRSLGGCCLLACNPIWSSWFLPMSCSYPFVTLLPTCCFQISFSFLCCFKYIVRTLQYRKKMLTTFIFMPNITLTI